MNTRAWTRPLLWDTTAPVHLALAGMVLRWVHSGSWWRARIVYGLLIWQLVGLFVLVIAGPAFADPDSTKPNTPNLADTSLFGWIDVKDSSNIPVSQYFIAVDQGNAFSIIPGINNDKKANIALAPILELEYGLFKITCQVALWIIGYGLSFHWLGFIAKPFDKLGAATESLTHGAGILTLALTLAGGVAAFAVVRGHFSKAAYQIGSAAVVTALVATVFAHPVAALVGPDGYLAKARDVGISSAVGITHAAGSSSVESSAGINQLQTALADEFLRTPTQMLNFNAIADKNGCKGAWNTGIHSGDRDKLKDTIAKCGASGKKMKYAADHLTGDRLASAFFMLVLSLILLTFGCYLIGKIVLTTVIALCNAIMLPIVGAGGVVAGALQGMAFKCLCNIGLALIKLPLTVVYAGAYAALLHSMLEVEGNPIQILLLATVLLVIAIVAFRRLSAGLHNGHSNILNFLNRGGGSPELPKAPLPGLVRRGGALALHAGAAAVGVPPSMTELAVKAGRGLGNKLRPGRRANQMPANNKQGDEAQQRWWDQQHQWYGAQYQWWAQNQHNNAATPTPATTSAGGAASGEANTNTNTTSASPARESLRLLYGPRGEVLREVPPLHPAVAKAVGAMPQQIQPAASLPPPPPPPPRPARPAPSAPPARRQRAASFTRPTPSAPSAGSRVGARPSPAAAPAARGANRSRVADLINSR